MNASTSRIARTLLLAALASAVAVGCSKKVKETPPADTGASTGTTTSTIHHWRTNCPAPSTACVNHGRVTSRLSYICANCGTT